MYVSNFYCKSIQNLVRKNLYTAVQIWIWFWNRK